MPETSTFEYIIQPDYYKDYYCLADKCPDTCCKGWNIEIDPEHLEDWKEFVPDLVEAVPFGKNKVRYRVRLNEKMVCPLLREDGLCSLVLSHGHDKTTQICQDFPRMKNDYEKILQKTVVIRCAYVLELLWKKGAFAYEILDQDMKPARTDFPVRELLDGLLEIGNKTSLTTDRFLAAVFDAFYKTHIRLDKLVPCDETGYKEYGMELIDPANTKETLDLIRKEEARGIGKGFHKLPRHILLKAGKNLEAYQDMMYELVKSFYDNPAFGPDFTDILNRSKALIKDISDKQLRQFMTSSYVSPELDRKLMLVVLEELFNSVCSVEVLDYQTMLVRLQWLIVQYLVIRYILFLDICDGRELTDDLVQFRISRIFRVTDLPDILRISYFDTEFLNWLWTPDRVRDLLKTR